MLRDRECWTNTKYYGLTHYTNQARRCIYTDNRDVSVECHYKQPTVYGDEVAIDVTVEEYTGVKLMLTYTMRNIAADTVVATGHSCNCYVDQNGNPISIKKYFPDFDSALKSLTKV